MSLWKMELSNKKKEVNTVTKVHFPQLDNFSTTPTVVHLGQIMTIALDIITNY